MGREALGDGDLIPVQDGDSAIQVTVAGTCYPDEIDARTQALQIPTEKITSIDQWEDLFTDYPSYSVCEG